VARASSVLKLVIAGDADSLKKTVRKSIGELDKLNKQTDKTSKGGFRNIGKAAVGAAAGIGAVTIAANEMQKSVSQTVDLAKATRQLQRATGLAAEDASALAAVLKVRGIDTNKLGRSFTSLARQIEAAKDGTGAAADAFERLGVSQKTLRTGNFNQVLLGLSDGFAKLGDGTSKAATAQQLFGRNSRDLLPLLEGGSEKLREQLALAPQLTDAQVKQALAMKAAQRDINLALMQVRTTIAVALLPYIEKAANFISEMFRGGNTEGGRFAAKLRQIYEAIKPAAQQLFQFVRGVVNFAAENPGLVKVAASLAAIGLAIKGMRFVSAVSGLSTFLKAAKGLGGPLRKIFERFGTRAGTAFAGEAAAGMAGSQGMGGALAPSGKLGKMGDKKNGKFAKWGARMGVAARAGFIAAMTYALVPAISKAISDEIPALRKYSAQGRKVGDNSFLIFDKESWANFFNTIIPFGDPVGTGRSGGRGSSPRRRNATAKGSAVGGRGASRRLRPNLNPQRGSIYDLRGMDPLTGGIPVEALLQRAEGKAASAQYRVDRFQATIGDSRSKAETKRLRELTRAAREAQREVTKLQKQLARRDALLEIRSSFKEFTQGFTDAYAQGLQNIADARLQAAQNLADKMLQSQLKNLDEEEGQSEEARRIRELREQQERDQKEREDKDYADNKQALDEQLERAIRNGNIRGAEDLRQQLEDLDQQRRDLLRSREITDLSESLQRQRNAAQSDYESRVGAAQEYYDKQLELNKQAVAEYKKVIEEQMGLLTAQLEAGKISYTEFNTRVDELNKWLTGMYQGDLQNRADAEAAAYAASVGATGTYVADINAEFDRVMKQFPVPAVPPIPTISVDAVLNIQSINGLPSSVGGGGGSTGQTPTVRTMTGQDARAWVKKHASSLPKTINASSLANLLGTGWNKSNTWAWSREAATKKLLKDLGITVRNRASGGSLSRSGLTMVGETGPELLMNGQVYSATKTARMSGAGVTLNVYPQTTADDPVALARALGWQLATR
jgi:hypothetical protein